MRVIGIVLFLVGFISFFSGAMILSSKGVPGAEEYSEGIFLMMKAGYYLIIFSALIYIFNTLVGDVLKSYDD